MIQPFYLYNTLKIYSFFSFCPLAESIVKTFFGVSIWNFNEKSISHVLCDTALDNKHKGGTHSYLKALHEGFDKAESLGKGWGGFGRGRGTFLQKGSPPPPPRALPPTPPNLSPITS